MHSANSNTIILATSCGEKAECTRNKDIYTVAYVLVCSMSEDYTTSLLGLCMIT